MKILLFAKRDRFDIDELARRHPDHDFVVIEGREDGARELPDAEVMITWTMGYDADFAAMVKDKARNLKWIQFTSSGIDNVLRAGGFPKGVIVTNSAGLAAPMVAEHAFALMMMVGHRLRDTEAAARARDWRRTIKPDMIALYHKTICIVGLGAIGQEAARRARGFDMNVVGVSRDYRPDTLVDEVYPRERLKEALARADVVLLSTVATADTLDMINADTLTTMKRGTILVNIARGDLVDEDALAAACRDGHLTGAGLDVTKVEPLPDASPLWQLPNVVITPHIAGGGSDNSGLLVDILDENIRRYTAGQPLTRVLDWENMKLA